MRKTNAAICTLFLLLLSILFSCNDIIPENEDEISGLDPIIENLRNKYQIPGLSVSVINKGKNSYRKGFGLLDISFQVPATDSSVYQIASVSKIFTGLAVMHLVKEDKLLLNAKVSEILEDVPDHWKDIEIRHLLSHTSGLKNKWESTDYLQLSDEEEKSLKSGDVLNYVKAMPLNFTPGTNWSYSQSGFTLVGHIIEQITGMTYQKYMQTIFFEPLHMNQSMYGSTETYVPNARPTAYTRQHGEFENWYWPFGPTDYQASGLFTSTKDLTKLFIQLQRGSLFEEKYLDPLWKKTVLPDGTVENYGQGWTVDEYKGFKVVGHEGGGAAWVEHFPELELTVIVLTNMAGSGADDIPYRIADFMIEEIEY